MKHAIRRAIGLIMLAVIFCPLQAWSTQCYVKRASFAVSEPNLVERVCYLFRHEARMYRKGETANQTLNMLDLHPDPLHVDFLDLVIKGKYVVLNPGVPVFSCQYDIEALRKDANASAVVNVRPPEFACDGNIYRLIPVRLANMNNCMWVAVEVVACDDVPPSPSTFIRDPTGP